MVTLTFALIDSRKILIVTVPLMWNGAGPLSVPLSVSVSPFPFTVTDIEAEMLTTNLNGLY